MRSPRLRDCWSSRMIFKAIYFVHFILNSTHWLLKTAGVTVQENRNKGKDITKSHWEFLKLTFSDLLFRFLRILFSREAAPRFRLRLSSISSRLLISSLSLGSCFLLKISSQLGKENSAFCSKRFLTRTT